MLCMIDRRIRQSETSCMRMHYNQNNHATRLLIVNNVGSKSIAHIGNASWKHGNEVGSFPNRVYERDVNRNCQNVRSIEGT